MVTHVGAGRARLPLCFIVLLIGKLRTLQITDLSISLVDSLPNSV